MKLFSPFQAGIRYSQSDLSSADRRGLLWLLDEEAIFPGATDESFVERLLLQYSQRGSQVSFQDLLNQVKDLTRIQADFS